jgi:hypothetical protein
MKGPVFAFLAAAVGAFIAGITGSLFLVHNINTLIDGKVRDAVRKVGIQRTTMDMIATRKIVLPTPENASPPGILGKNQNVINALSYAPSTGSDWTQALQSAIGATANQTLYIPAGVYPISASIVISGNLDVIGDGEGMTTILLTSPAQNGFRIQGSAAVHFYRFTLLCHTAATSGSGILYESTGGNSSFEHLAVDFGYTGITIAGGSTLAIRDCWFLQYANSGLVVSGSEDSFVDGCNFASGNANAAGISYTGGSGWASYSQQ